MTREPMPIPIFIVGVPRSGTTLLRVILDSHPDIACGPEFPFLTENVAAIWGRHWPSMEGFSSGTPLKIFSNFNFTETDVHKFCARFVEDIFCEYARRRNKCRWAIKVPRLVEKLDFMSKLYPDAYYVHVVRDGRDVVASSITQREKEPGWYPDYRARDFASDWFRMVTKARADACSIRRYVELRYERLIAEPRTTISSLLSFLEAPWDDAVLNHQDQEHDYSAKELSTHQVKKPLYSGAISSRQRVLSSAQLAEIMELEGFSGLLRSEGYL